MEIRPLLPEEQKYTYSQSMQLEGQTGCIGHLRGDFADSGYGFYTTWFDTGAQWKTDEFKAEFDEVINALREDKGLLHNRYDMRAFARSYPVSAFLGNYCTEYGFRADTEKHAFLFRCNPTRGDYNFYCYCYVREWLDRHIGRAEQGIRFIDSGYKELFRIPDGGRIIVTTAWNEKMEYSCRFIDECHTEIGNNLYHICEFAERMERNGATYEPKPTEPPQKAAKHKNFYEEHKTIQFDTLTEQAEYEIIAVFKTVAYSSDGYRYYDFVDAENEEEFSAYVGKCKELALYDTGVTAEYGDRLITLSTCEYSAQNGRLVVVAKKAN